MDPEWRTVCNVCVLFSAVHRSLNGGHMEAANPDSIDQVNGYNVTKSDVLIENATTDENSKGSH